MHIRKHMFETNSSSSHTLIISNDGNVRKQPFENEVTESGVFELLPNGEYGWGYDSYNDVLSKLDYLAIYCRDVPELWETAKAKILAYSGVDVVLLDGGKHGYIDHQSAYGEDLGLANIVRSDDTQLIDWLFNDDSSVIISNDNI